MKKTEPSSVFFYWRFLSNMARYDYMDRIRAQVVSLGGGILGGLFLVLFVLLWIVTHLGSRHIAWEGALVLFVFGMGAYVVDAASEVLEFVNDEVVFTGLLTHRRIVSLFGVEEILLVHEGLNPEWGIETLTFRRADGDMQRLALGPLWRRSDLVAFLAHMEHIRPTRKLVDGVR